MLESSLRNVYLVDELQLGQRLNNDLSAQDRADFALMLSMLSKDLLDQPISLKARIDQIPVENYRDYFNLQPEQRKYAEHDDFVRADMMSETFAESGHREVFLNECIRSEPLVPIKHDLDPDVINQFSPLMKEKVLRYFEGEEVSQNEMLTEQGDGFGIVDEIQSSTQQIHEVV